MKLSRKEDFVLRKLVARELREARMEFWGTQCPVFRSKAAEKAGRKKFDRWYRTGRTHIDRLLKGVEAFEDDEGIAMAYLDGFVFSAASRFADAYGLVFEATKNIDYEHGDINSVDIGLLEKALEEDPDNEEALYVVADYFMVKDPSRAERIVDRLIEVDPAQPLAYAFKAAIMMGKEKPGKAELDKARSYAARAYDLDPNNFEIVSTCAQISYLQGDTVRYEQFVNELYELGEKRADRFVEKHSG